MQKPEVLFSTKTSSKHGGFLILTLPKLIILLYIVMKLNNFFQQLHVVDLCIQKFFQLQPLAYKRI